jgi:hypothetical protein
LKLKRNILILSLSLAVLLSACGKKTDPLPKDMPVMRGINDLRGEVKDGVLFLSFSLPRKNKDGSEVKDLAGFRIMKNCGTCLGSWEKWKEVRFEEARGYTVRGGRLYVYDDDLMAGVDYGYRVYPFTTRGLLADPSNSFFLRWEKPPVKPREASATGGDGTVELRWAGEEGYRYNVYRYDGEIYPVEPRNTGGALTEPMFIDRDLENGRSYRYEVRKVEEKGGIAREGEGLRIDAIPVDRTPPSAPRNIKAQKEQQGIRVSWDANTESDLLGYNLYRIGAGTTEKMNAEPLTARTFDDGRTAGFRYLSYFVTAVDRSGNESEPSREAIIMMRE